MSSQRKTLLIGAALAVVVLVAGTSYWIWKSREMARFLADYLPNTRAGGAGDAVLGSIGVKRYGKPTWFERTHAPRWQSLVVLKSAVLSLDSKLTAKLNEFGVGSSELGQAKVSAGLQSGQEAKLAVLQVADASALAAEIQALTEKDSALAEALAARDVRVITAVGVVVSQKEAEGLTFDVSATRGSLPPSAPAANATSIRAGGAISTAFAVLPGAVLFYRMSRLCWDKNRTLARLAVDAKGTDTCPEGLSPTRPTSQPPRQAR